MPVSALTRSFNNHRTGANLEETVLTPEGIRAHGIRLLFTIDLPGDARGTEGMPLVVSGLTMRDGLKHDVLFVATMGNDVGAFDANTGQRLWWQLVANPIKSIKAMDSYPIADYWGILSTPVIDPETGTLYVVAMSSPDGTYRNTSFHLHTLSLLDGSAQALPLDLNQASYHASVAKHDFLFGSVARKQRPGLLFDRRNGKSTVFVATGSFSESASTNQGWLIACDVTNLKPSITACWTSTVRYSGAGLWMGGQGPSMDDDGCIYVTTGNGAFDGRTEFGESFVKLRYDGSSLVPVDWFTPFTDTGRVGGDPTVVSLTLLKGIKADDDDDALSNMTSPNDSDLNSGGPLYISKTETGYDKNLIVGAGKDGILYVIDANNMGKTKLESFAPDRIQKEVYGSLLSPPIGFTYDPRPMNTAPTDLSELATTQGGFTHHQHSTPTFYVSSDHGPMLLTGGENGPVRGFRLNADYTLTYLGCGAEIASPGAKPPGGMPGTMMTLSANGKNDGILWCTQPLGDANKSVVPGRLIAYAANWFVGAPGSGAMVKLWSSDQWNIQFSFCKFNIPCCVNGKVYLPTYDGRILAFG